MATSAFKSTTRRTPIGNSPPATDSSASSTSTNRATSAHRRSRSLSRFSRRLPSAVEDYSDDTPAPPTRGKFVNTVRGSGFPETTLDDLAVDIFGSARGGQGRWGSREDDVSEAKSVSSSQRRGRSVSRQGSFGKGSNGNSCKGTRADSEIGNLRRRRSVSVVRYHPQMSDSESDQDHPQNLSNHANLRSLAEGNRKVLSSDKTAFSNSGKGLMRSVSQKDIKYHDDYSSHSSTLTDDEGRDAHSHKNGSERTIRAVYAQKKVDHPSSDDMNCGLYEAMRKELRTAVDEIKMELEQSRGKRSTSVSSRDDCFESRDSDVHQVVSAMRKSYATKLEESEKRKHDLLAEIVLEEQRGKELFKIVKELLPDPQHGVSEKPLRTRKRSTDRSRMSKRLTEEAEKYIEDFLSNIEDTDISSLDGERSETSSSLGGIAKMDTFQSPPLSKYLPAEMDGVVLPWLQWETANDASPLLSDVKVDSTTLKTNSWHAAQESSPAQAISNHSASSRGSWSPLVADGQSTNNVGEVAESQFGELERGNSQYMFAGRKSRFDVEEYRNRPTEEDLLFERWRQENRIQSGSLLLCNHGFFF